MKGDFCAKDIDPKKSFTRVLMQQGRVQVDADWNEQASILLHYMQTLATDLIGPHGGPSGHFEIGADGANNFAVSDGRYFVMGNLCENPDGTTYTDLPESSRPDTVILANNENYIVYLDVWERHVSHVSDDSIREKALNGPDTSTRTQLVWQIRILSTALTGANAVARYKTPANAYENFLSDLPPELAKPGTGALKATTNRGTTNDSDPCIISPESRYRGTENQLYRVEIHSEKDTTVADSTATWKWSRDNGVVIFPIRSLQTDGKSATVTVEHLGRDERFGLKAGDWAEIVDDDYELLGLTRRLLKVKEVRTNDLQVILDGKAESNESGTDPQKHPLLRRWDQKQTSNVDLTAEGVIPVPSAGAIELEDGITVEFSDGEYRTGDYWLIPARVASGDVEWPKDEFARPHGIRHSYAPLAHIAVDGTGNITPTNLRHTIKHAVT